MTQDFDPERLAQLTGASLDRDYADLVRRRREAAARWNPLRFMDQPEAAEDAPQPLISTPHYADRQRLFWGAHALALIVWGPGGPAPPPQDIHVQLALEYTANVVCRRGPNLVWPTAFEDAQDALGQLPSPPSLFTELPQGAQAAAELRDLALPAPLKEPEMRGFFPVVRLRDIPITLAYFAQIAATAPGRRARLRLFWVSVWLALAAWGAPPSDWVEEPVRTRAREAIQHAADAVCARTSAGLKAAEAEVRVVLDEARAARSTRGQP